MTFEQAKKQFKNELMEQQGAKTWGEVVTRLGKTTIRCYWVDWVDSITKGGEVREKISHKWGQII